MIIDSHVHVVLPVEKHIALMDEAGVDKTILFSTSIHPEVATYLDEFEKELNKLYEIISGNKNSIEAKITSIFKIAITYNIKCLNSFIIKM